ncbi:hypothetical protein DSO57_1038027 [Entomophthora muscae]|uniref:Uncharacterized protein n=1 Tax=Entomophthora muscae TaxID=34485 RepID=A0ACC2RPT4_9FUNG|nr:hypothetical protein DSO57_1038027 [Entomophthora muscae]
MDLSMTQSLGLLLLPPQTLMAASKIDALSNKLQISLDGTPGFFSLLLSREDPPISCLSLQASPETPSPFVLPGILVPYKGAFDVTVNPLPPLALDQTVFPCRTKKSPKIMAELLNSLGDLAHTVDEIFFLAYPADPLALVVPAWEETLINLDYLLAWCCPLLKTIRNSQSKENTSMVSKSTESEMVVKSSSQSGGVAEITLKPPSTPGSGQHIFSSSQPNASQISHVIIP